MLMCDLCGTLPAKYFNSATLNDLDDAIYIRVCEECNLDECVVVIEGENK